MASHAGRKRPNSCEDPNAPPYPFCQPGTQEDHPARSGHADEDRDLKIPENSRYFVEEGRLCDFFCGGAPGHGDTEEVGEDGLREVNG